MANKVIFEIATTKGFRFEAQLSSEDVAHVVDAMPARIKLHAYDYQRFGVLPGVVEFVSPDSSATNEAKAPSYVVRIDVPNELPARQHTATVKLGMTGDAAAAYAKEVVAADFEEAGEADVLRKVLGDLTKKGVAVSEADVRAKMAELMKVAVDQVKAGQ